jgi:OOP family OmpA-OmpF porin
MKLNYAGAAAIIFGLSVTTGALASEQEGQWYIKGMGTYIDPASDRDLDDGIAGGVVGIGRAYSEHLNFELESEWLDVDGDNGPDTEFLSLAANGMYVWNRAGSFSPFLLAGVGAVNIDPDSGGDDTEFEAQAGPGFLWDLGTERLALRGEALGRYADSETDLLVRLGLQFAFGGEKEDPAPAPAAVVAAPIDSDGDGVTDDIDQCPNTPRGTPVDEVGCPIPVDSDGDGVTDDIDQCPDTIKGALVDAVGCAYKLRGVDFAFDSAELGGDAEAILDEVAERLTNESFQDVTITIEGHTDSRGDEAYNRDLSQRRAQAAGDYLAAKGVAEDRITVIGRGESSPLATNDTEEGRAQNRRVTIIRDGAAPE